MIHHQVRYVIDWALLAKWSNASNIVIALFAGVVCFVYWKQLVTMRRALAGTKASNEIAAMALEQTRLSNAATERSNEIAERSLVLGRRAWLVIRGVPKISIDGWTFDDVTVENVTDMPAVIQRFGTCSVEKLDASTPKDWKYVKAGEVVVRGKQASIDFPSVALPSLNLNDPDTYRVLDRVSIYCVVEYTDCFEKTWSTTAYWRELKEVEGGHWQLGAAHTTMT